MSGQGKFIIFIGTCPKDMFKTTAVYKFIGKYSLHKRCDNLGLSEITIYFEKLFLYL